MMEYGIDNFDSVLFDNALGGAQKVVEYCYSDVITTKVAFDYITMKTMRIEKSNNWLKQHGFPMRRGKENRFVKSRNYYILGVDLNHENNKSN